MDRSIPYKGKLTFVGEKRVRVALHYLSLRHFLTKMTHPPPERFGSVNHFQQDGRFYCIRLVTFTMHKFHSLHSYWDVIKYRVMMNCFRLVRK